MAIFRENAVEPKRLRIVQQKADVKPSLFLLECVRGGKSGLEILPNLIIEEDGDYSQEMMRIYGDYREGYDG